MPTDPPPDLALTPLQGSARTVGAWLTTFPLVFVAVDPFNERSAWIVATAGRILKTYEQADCRVAWLVGGYPEEAVEFLGSWAGEFLTFVDPELQAIDAMGLERLPVVVHLAMDGTVVDAVEGWDPMGWRRLTTELSKRLAWSRPAIPGPHDPAPFTAAPVREAEPAPGGD